MPINKDMTPAIAMKIMIPLIVPQKRPAVVFVPRSSPYCEPLPAAFRCRFLSALTMAFPILALGTGISQVSFGMLCTTRMPSPVPVR
jgi:hypothetical protein